MNISNCPRCNDAIRVPETDPSHDSQAQCPWCGETFPLAEVINRLPPLLTILDADGTAIRQGAHDSIASQPAAMSWQDDGAVSPSELDSFVVADGRSAVNKTVAFDRETLADLTDSSVAATPNIQATPRRRNSGGGLRSLLGVVLGGLLAVPIAGGILWYFGLGPFQDSGRRSWVASEPLEIGEEQTPGAIQQTPPAGSSASDQTEFGQPGLVLPETDPPASTTALAPEDPAQSEPAQSDPRQSDSAQPDSVQADSLPTEFDLEDPPSLQAAAGDALIDNFEAVQPDQSEMVKDQPEAPQAVAESTQLIDTINRAKQMVMALDTSEGDDPRRIRWLATTYKTIARAGELAESKGPAMEDLAQTIKGAKILDELDKAGADWMQLETRENDGVLIIGEYDGSSIALGSGANVKIAGTVVEPETGRVIVLGRIVDSETVKAVVIDSLP